MLSLAGIVVLQVAGRDAEVVSMTNRSPALYSDTAEVSSGRSWSRGKWQARAHLEVNFSADYVQRLARLHFEEVKEVGDCTEQDTPTDTNGLCEIPLLILSADVQSAHAICSLAALFKLVHSRL